MQRQHDDIERRVHKNEHKDGRLTASRDTNFVESRVMLLYDSSLPSCACGAQ